MPGLEIKAHAKINLSLDVLRKRDDGYHELKMIMQTISLHDTVLLEKTPGINGIALDCESSLIPHDSTNIAWKAAGLLMERFSLKCGVKIKIEKRIPVAAGLAGGSSDAAAVLKGMNRLFSLGMGIDELRKTGKLLGADVPYCISGGTMLAEGIGERLTELSDFSGVDILLVKPGVGVSTAWVYGNLDIGKIRESDRPETEFIGQAIVKHDIKSAAGAMKNVLEKVTIPSYPVIQELKEKLLETGALGSMMSGSGPTVFGVFADSSSTALALSKLSADKRWKCYQTKTINSIKE